jgi:hypothetical protein
MKKVGFFPPQVGKVIMGRKAWKNKTGTIITLKNL